MPAKTTKSTKSRSNVARATGKASLLNKKVEFNWKIAVVIGIVLVAALGYLFVRLSEAGKVAYKTWYAESFETFSLSPTPNTYNGTEAAYPGSFPNLHWYGSDGGFRFTHANPGAGQYCYFGADTRKGGGEPVTSIKIYGINGTTKTLASSVAGNKQCVNVVDDISKYPNREFEYYVTGGAASVGSVTFVPAAAADGKGTFWFPTQMSLYEPGMYGTLQTPGYTNLPRYVSQRVASGGTTASPGGDYLYLSFNTDSTVAEQYCVEGYAPKGTQFAIDASNKGPRDVQYETVTNVDGGLRYRMCRTLTPAAGVTKVNLFMTAPIAEFSQITVENAYRKPAVATTKAK